MTEAPCSSFCVMHPEPSIDSWIMYHNSRKISRETGLCKSGVFVQERVFFALVADRRCGTMAGKYLGIIRKDHEIRFDRANERHKITARKIRPPDGSCKQ